MQGGIRGVFARFHCSLPKIQGRTVGGLPGAAAISANITYTNPCEPACSFRKEANVYTPALFTRFNGSVQHTCSLRAPTHDILMKSQDVK